MAVTQQQIIGRLKPAIAKDLLKRGLRVQSQARKLLSGADGHIKRVDTGDLRSSIQTQPRDVSGVAVVRIGSSKKHARWVHDGTGIYGPKRRLITPTTARVLVFSSQRYGAKKGKFRSKVVVRSVRGMKPNHYLRDALPAAKIP